MRPGRGPAPEPFQQLAPGPGGPPTEPSRAPASFSHSLRSLSVHPSASARIQTKLSVAAPADIYEQEAERVADQVVGTTPPRGPAGGGAPRIRRASSAAIGIEPSADFAATLRGSGQGSPLPEGTRSFMEPRFGVDLRRVRIHSGESASRLNRAVNARAFTHQEHIYMGEDAGGLGGDAGRRLLAHELAHTIQQGAVGPSGGAGPAGGLIQRDPSSPEAPGAAAPPAGAAAAMSLSARLARITALVQNKWTGANDEREILDLLAGTPSGEAAELLSHVDGDPVGAKTLHQALDDSVDGANNLELHATLTKLQLKTKSAASAVQAVTEAPVLPWHDVMGVMEDAATFFVEDAPKGKVRVKYPQAVMSSHEFGSEISRLDLDHFIGGHDYEPGQILKIHDYDANTFVTVSARELMGYRHLGVRSFLERAVTVAGAAIPVGAAESAASIILSKVIPALGLLVNENRRNLVKWFPRWGNQIIEVTDDIQTLAAVIGFASLAKAGWTLFTRLKALREEARLLKAAGEESQRVIDQLGRDADEIVENANKSRQSDGAAGAKAAGGEGAPPEPGPSKPAPAKEPAEPAAAAAVQAPKSTIQDVLGEAEYAKLKAAAETAKAAHPELAALTADEIIAIRAYSNESWSTVNAALRIKDAKELTRLGQFITLIKSGLGKLPAFKGTVIRTIGMSTPDAARKYQVGAIIIEEAFTSTTFGKTVAQREGNILLTIESSTGRNITSAAIHEESEILFAPGARFVVTAVERTGMAFLVSMREVL